MWYSYTAFFITYTVFHLWYRLTFSLLVFFSQRACSYPSACVRKTKTLLRLSKDVEWLPRRSRTRAVGLRAFVSALLLSTRRTENKIAYLDGRWQTLGRLTYGVDVFDEDKPFDWKMGLKRAISSLEKSINFHILTWETTAGTPSGVSMNSFGVSRLDHSQPPHKNPAYGPDSDYIQKKTSLSYART